MFNFIERCLNGLATPEQIEDVVEDWHTGDSKLSLREHLGLNEEEYHRWALSGAAIHAIIEEHRQRDAADLVRVKR